MQLRKDQLAQLQKLTRKHLREIGVEPTKENQLYWSRHCFPYLVRFLNQEKAPTFKKAAFQALYYVSYQAGYHSILERNAVLHAAQAEQAIAEKFVQQVAGQNPDLQQVALSVLTRSAQQLEAQLAKAHLVVQHDNLQGYLWRIAIRSWQREKQHRQRFSNLEPLSQKPEAIDNETENQLTYQQGIRLVLVTMAPLLSARHYQILEYWLNHPEADREELLEHFQISEVNWRQIKSRICRKILDRFGSRQALLQEVMGH